MKTIDVMYMCEPTCAEPVNRGRGEEGRKGGKRKREGKGKPVGIHRYFDCSSFIIYAGPSINYSDARNNNKNINCVA